MKTPILTAMLGLVLGAPWVEAGAQTTGEARLSPGWEMSRAGDIERVLPVRERAMAATVILHR